MPAGASPTIADVDKALPAPDSPRAWLRLAVALAIATVGGAGQWCVVVALPAVQAEFGVERGTASLPYTALMLGVAAGSVIFGRLTDRIGIATVAVIGSVMLSAGFALAALAPNLALFALVHGVLIGFGCSAAFGPVMSDISFWFARRRGIAVAVAAAGNYVAGAIWPPLVQAMIQLWGWHVAFLVIAAICAVLLVPLCLALGQFGPAPATGVVHSGARPAATQRNRIALPGGVVQTLLIVAGVGCCTAMAMPQVHIVAYCGDRGFGAARGAEMLSLMLACGIVSRLASGVLADRIGGLGTLLVGSMLQCAALTLFMLFDSLGALFVISGLFGLFQGGIVPSYAIVIREVFPGAEAGRRFGMVLASTLVGMSLGGWLGGRIFDLAGSYQLAFADAVAWNLLNLAIAAFLMWKAMGRSSRTPQPALA